MVLLHGAEHTDCNMHMAFAMFELDFTVHAGNRMMVKSNISTGKMAFSAYSTSTTEHVMAGTFIQSYATRLAMSCYAKGAAHIQMHKQPATKYEDGTCSAHCEAATG